MERKLINKKEIGLIVLVLVACLAGFLYYGITSNEKIAKITVDGEIYREINLSRNRDEYVLDIHRGDKAAHIKISGDKIGFIDHECPDGICENAGMIGTSLQTAVCLPLKVSITIEQGKEKIDAVAG